MKRIISIALVTVTALAVRTAWGQLGSAYFQAVTNLNPVVYYPLQDQFTPAYVNDVETNWGSLGQGFGGMDDAVYVSQYALKGNGNLGVPYLDGSVLFNASAGSFMAVPTTDTNNAIKSSAFTVECWVDPTVTYKGFEAIISKSSADGDGIGISDNTAGWILSQDYVAYLDSDVVNDFDFHVFNGIGRAGAEIIVPCSITSSMPYHLVATFDGTNCQLYINGVNMAATGQAIQIPMPPGTKYVPDTWDPLCIGCGRGQNSNPYEGGIGDVAIYTNALPASSVSNHYNAAYNGPNYDSAVANDNPYIFYKMIAQSGAYTPPAATYSAAGYGTFANAYSAIYGTAVFPAQPGPQFAGMLDPTLGNQSYGVAVNGIGGANGEAYSVLSTNPVTSSTYYVEDSLPISVMWSNPNSGVDAVGNPLLNPTNHEGFSTAIWFKGNPSDHNRFQNICGHSDTSWRIDLSSGSPGVIEVKAGNANTQMSSDYGFDDGLWHHVVYTYDGTNVENLYVDGRLSVTSSGNSSLEVGSADDVLLGSDPMYANCGNPVPSGAPTGVFFDSGYENRNLSGAIAHFAFWTNALSAAQVQSLYSNAAPNEVPYVIAQPPAARSSGSGGDGGIGTGSYIYFATVAGGTPPLNFQWYYSSTSNYNGTALSSGTKYILTSTNNPVNGQLQLVVSNLVTSDSGFYYCIVTNNAGSVTSILAGLSLNYAPVITSQSPTGSITLYSGQEADLSVTATTGTNTLAYQWYVNGTADPNGTNTAYLTAPQFTAGNVFQCIVTNAYGTATSMPVTVSQILSMPAVLTNSAFSSNIMASGATAFWPMNETGETPAAGDIETNYGTWGASANGVYGDWRSSWQASLGVLQDGGLEVATNITILHGIRGAIAGDTDPAECFFDDDGSEIVVPHNSPGLTLVPPFTLEAWMRPNYDGNFGIAISEHSGTFNATGNSGGFDWLYSGSSNCFSMTVYNGNGGGSVEPKTTASYPPGAWYHVVTTYDGTNVYYYIDGVQDSMNGPNGTNTQATMAPNYWDPITIGCGRGLGANGFYGSLDEMAIYTNYLMPLSVIQKHYQDGTNAAYANYKEDVLSLTPALYLRMDAPIWTPPPTSTWPTLTNYGSVGINGYYTPNAVPSSGPAPSVNGVTPVGLPANSSFRSDGVMSFADALNAPVFHPSGKTPFSVAAWMKTFPCDIESRNWQSIVANGDSSWRMNLNAGNGRASFNCNGGSSDLGDFPATGAGITINDGQWHWVVGTCDGSNTVVYVDGLVSSKTNNTSLNETSQNVSVFLSAYPDDNTGLGAFPNEVAYEGNNAVSGGSGRVMAGDMCDAAYWYGTVLTSNQINSIYQSMNIPPIIDVQPASAVVNQGTAYTNVTYVSGTPPLSYQWYQNGSLAAGQTNENLIFPSVQLSNGATNNGYYMVVKNAYGSVTSVVAQLVVNAAPYFTNNLNAAYTNMTVWAGTQLPEFSVLAAGAVPLYYQWFSNSVAFAAASVGASNIVITVPAGVPATVTNNYYCVVTNSVGSATSLVAQVTIMPAPSAPYVSTIIADRPLAFWRLNEPGVDGPEGGPNDGVIAYDYAGNNNGLYTNVDLGFPPNNPNDTNAFSAAFGFAEIQNCDVSCPSDLDFGAPSGSNSNFSVECWIQGTGQQTSDAGLVSKGWGGGGEEFNLDCGSDGSTAANGVTNPYDHSIRFFVRTEPSSNVVSVVSAVNPEDQAWHHVVGVCDETNGYVLLYIDGQLIGESAISATTGILPAANRLLLIGSRPSSETTNINSYQFDGYMQDVAVYKYALSAQQVLKHYEAADIPAQIVQPPTNTVAGYGGSATFSVLAEGTLPIGYQWWDVNANAPISGATNATLVLNPVYNQDSYYCVVTNNFGTNSSADEPASLTIVQGAPQFYNGSGNLQPQYLVFEGQSISLSVSVYGTEPLSYHWLFDTNTVLQNNYQISGANTNVLSISPAQLSNAGTYQCVITNSYGSITSSIAVLVVGGVPVNFNSNSVSDDGLGWTANQSGTFSTVEVTNGVLELTDDGGSEARSFFFNYPQYIGAFEASFVYQIGGDAVADGMSFCIQNDPRGASALGEDGGSFGVAGTGNITPSWEVEFNMYQNADGVGYNVYTNGTIGDNVPLILNPGGYSLTNGDNGDPLAVSLTYLSGQVSLTVTDTVNHAGMYTNFPASIPATVGGETAYVGFTGGDGGSESIQTITDFSFLSIPTAQIQPNIPEAVISWPDTIPGYTLQENSSLLKPNNWVNVTNAAILSNGLYQVTVPVGTTNEFYRLSAP
ncbi:MAG TPA: LamG-like jellyroll fold domain-containing protein [Candidatus Sulfotelmatobacter sp.]|nr:LamG-like jellyroll fold domain-containing protein [Candidatus Sulfotelmatobacter sp.]